MKMKNIKINGKIRRENRAYDRRLSEKAHWHGHVIGRYKQFTKVYSWQGLPRNEAQFCASLDACSRK